jgi:hypothetical protein
MSRTSAALAVVALLALATAPPAGAAERRACGSGKLVAAGAQALLFKHGTTLWGCERGARRARAVARQDDYNYADDPPSWRIPTLAGRWAAVQQSSTPRNCTTYTVSVTDLRTGHARSYLAGSGRDDPPDMFGCTGYGGEVADLALRSDGVAAFIVRHPQARWEVARTRPTRAGNGEVPSVSLARDPAINPRSLVLTRTGVAWTSGGEPRWAPLPPRAQ